MGAVRKLLRRLQPEQLGLGLLAALAATFPLVMLPMTSLPGSELVGAYSHVWKYWWTHQALVELGTNPAFSPLLNHPEGLEVGYYLASFMNGIWSLPVTHWLGPVAAFNFICLLSTATGFWAAALLARSSGLTRPVASFTGLAWSLCPHHLGFMMGGAIENLANAWIPLFLLALLRLLRCPALTQRSEEESTPLVQCGWAFALALSLFLAAMTSWFTGLILAALGGMLWLAAAFAWRERSLVGMVWAAGGLCLGGLVVMLAARSLLPSPPATAEPLLMVNTAHISALRMGELRAFSEEEIFSSTTLWLNHHLVLTLAALALLGLASRRGRWWLLLTLPFVLDFLLPQGLFRSLHITAPEQPSVIFTAVALMMADAMRRLFPLHLLLALAAGHGLGWLCERLEKGDWLRTARGLPVLAALLWTLEAVLSSPVALPIASFAVTVPPHARHLAQVEGGAVIDLPLMVEEGTDENPWIKSARSRYLFEQTVHRHPVLTAVGSRLSYDPQDLGFPDPLVLRVDARCRGLGAVQQGAWDGAELYEAGFRWIVLHAVPSRPACQQLQAFELGVFFGEPLLFEDGVRLYRIEEGR